MLSFPNLQVSIVWTLDSLYSSASILNTLWFYDKNFSCCMVPWIWQHFDAFASNIQHLTFIIDLYTLVSVAFVLFIKEARYRTQAKQQWTSCWIFYPHRRAKCCTSFMGYVFIHILSLFPECYSVKITLL